MGKRRFLKNLSTLGVSATTLKYISHEKLRDLTSDPSEMVPIPRWIRHTNHEEYAASHGTDEVVAPQREAIFARVPHDEWVVSQGTFNAAQKLNQNHPIISSSRFIVPGSTTLVRGNKSKQGIRVMYYEPKTGPGPAVGFDELREHLPESVTGSVGTGSNRSVVEDIPVVAEKGIINPTGVGWKYRPIPGGCKMQTHGYDGQVGTITAPAYDHDSVYGSVWLTAAHLFTDDTAKGTTVNVSSGIDSFQEKWELHDPNFFGNSTGEGYFSNPDFDAATIKPKSGGPDPKNNIAGLNSGNDYDWPIMGIVPWDTIVNNEAMEDGPYSLYLLGQGYATGRNNAPVEQVNADGTFQGDWAGQSTDSGGPHFEVDSDEAYIAGTVSQYYYDYNERDVLSISAEKIENTLGIWI